MHWDLRGAVHDHTPGSFGIFSYWAINLPMSPIPPLAPPCCKCAQHVLPQNTLSYNSHSLSWNEGSTSFTARAQEELDLHKTSFVESMHKDCRTALQVTPSWSLSPSRKTWAEAMKPNEPASPGLTQNRCPMDLVDLFIGFAKVFKPCEVQSLLAIISGKMRGWDPSGHWCNWDCDRFSADFSLLWSAWELDSKAARRAEFDGKILDAKKHEILAIKQP